VSALLRPGRLDGESIINDLHKGCKGVRENRESQSLAAMLEKKIQPAFKRIGVTGVGWHTFRHAVESMLAEMGELCLAKTLRSPEFHACNKLHALYVCY
jgi:hypothetical protein